MKNFYKCTAISCLVLFSFFYTEKIIGNFNKYDPIMKELNQYDNINSECVEGYSTKNGFVPGINGREINKNESYYNMKGIGYSENLMVFSEKKCIFNKEDNVNSYIVGGNPVKNNVSFLIYISDGTLINKFVEIAEFNNIKLSIVTNGNFLETNKEKFKTIYKQGHDILYNGIDEIDFYKYLTIMKEIDKDSIKYCVYSKYNDVIDNCGKEKINSIKTELNYDKNLYLNVKSNLESGNIYIIKENKNILEEFNLVINFIKNKGLMITNLKKHLN